MQQPTEQEAHEIGVEAYVYFYPLVSIDVTRRIATNVEAGKIPMFGPKNAFSHGRAFPTADFRAVVRPNFDTLYSSAWLDLTKEPMVVSAPDTGERYYLLPMLDMWSDVFASPGKRTSGTKAGNFAVVPPGWQGQLPSGVDKIQAPTPYVWVIGRTQTNGPKDYAAVNKVQDGYTITPLSQWGKTPQPVAAVIDPSVDMKTPPLDQVNKMPAAAYFKYAAELMKLHPPHVTDWSIVARLKRIGVEPGKSFDYEKLSPSVQQVLSKAATDGLKEMYAKLPTFARVVNGWQMNTDTMGVYGIYYLKRAAVAMAGLGANQPEDAIYPLNFADADGKPLVGEHNYVLHFAKEQLPPVNAFWSVTMYDEAGFQVANPLNRFAIGDRDNLKYNADGSLDLYIQNESPGSDKESNWLPSPAKGTLGVTMRLYAPKPEALDGRWNPSAIKLVKAIADTGTTKAA
ncbi:MAG: DUF1254 domain-containing protein [Candidatus Sulfotelmatobacter sp.]